MKQTVFHIGKMDCPTEEQIIRNRLRTVRGVTSLSFDLFNQRLTILHELDDPGDLQTALESVGMDPKMVFGDAPVEESVRSPWESRILALSGVLAAVAEITAFATDSDASPVVIALAVASIVVGGRQTLVKGWASVKTFTLNINFLMSIAIVGAICVGQWPEAAMVSFLFALAERIEAASLDRARRAVRSLMQMAPPTAEVRDSDGEWREVSLKEVREGNTVRVRPGQRIGLDGEVVAGASSVNQAAITGESMPVEKHEGDRVFAGTVNERGSLEYRATSESGHTTLDRIIQTIQRAQSERAPTERFVDQFARIYTPIVVLLAILTAAIPPLFFAQPFADWLYKALVMLVIACPCALVLSTPVTVVSGLAAAARQGILVKGGVYLELGRKIPILAFDKTGTLTEGAPKLTDVVPIVDRSRDELLQIAASIDAPSEHPVASAIVAGWTMSMSDNREKALAGGTLFPVQDFEALPGRGVRGRIDGVLYYVGNHRLAHDLNICGRHVEDVLEPFEADAKTAVILATETQVLAVLAVADTLRESTSKAVSELHALGLKTVMLTGDNVTTATAIARKLGIEDARGDLLPDDKLAAIDELLAKHRFVGMVGDGINDAPALAKSTIGFAMGAAGTDTAMETADVALMQDDLGHLPMFFRLSRVVGRVLAQNIAIAIGIKAVFFAMALTGNATLWMAVFADVGASLIVVANGLRLLRFKG